MRDPRILKITDDPWTPLALTSLSWLLPVELSADGREVKCVHYDRAIAPAASYQSLGLEDARISKVGARWWMTVCSVSPERLGTSLYSSADARDWRLEGLVLDHQNKDMLLFEGLVGGEYWAQTRPLGDVWFAYPPGSEYRAGPAIQLASSPDALHWRPRAEPGIRPHSATLSTAKMGGGAPPIRTPEGWLSLWHGVEAGAEVGIYRTYWSLLDPQEPWRVLRTEHHALIEPAPALTGALGDRMYLSNVVFTTGIGRCPRSLYRRQRRGGPGLPHHDDPEGALRVSEPAVGLPPPWWKSATIYQIYPRSFQDTDGDGIGDLAGIAARLDHLVWLGVDALWLSPIFPSPMADFGYDVANYTDVGFRFGTLADFDRLLDAAHAKGLRVLLDLVPNHSSDRHVWFEESRSAPDSPLRDWYIWRDPAPDGGPPNNWISDFGGPAWERDAASGQYYSHAFLKEQPDLNWRNPELRGRDDGRAALLVRSRRGRVPHRRAVAHGEGRRLPGQSAQPRLAARHGGDAQAAPDQLHRPAPRSTASPPRCARWRTPIRANAC